MGKENKTKRNLWIAVIAILATLVAFYFFNNSLNVLQSPVGKAYQSSQQQVVDGGDWCVEHWGDRWKTMCKNEDCKTRGNTCHGPCTAKIICGNSAKTCMGTKHCNANGDTHTIHCINKDGTEDCFECVDGVIKDCMLRTRQVAGVS